MNRIHALALALCPILVACDSAEQDRGAGGFGSETTNGIQVAGSGEAGTILTARRLDRVEAPYRTRIDSTGNLEWKLPPGSWAVQGSLGERSFQRHLILRPTDSATELEWLTLAAPGTLQGRVVGLPASPAADLNVWLPGMGRCVPINRDGSFRFDDVPLGPYVIRLVQGNTVLAETFGHTCDCASIVLNPSDRSFLLDDFDNDGTPRVAYLLPHSQWMVWGGLAASMLLPDGLSFAQLLTDTGAWSGRSLHAPEVKTQFGSSTLALMFGSRGVSEGESFYDLSGSDSLVFQVKGSGRLDLELWARPKDRSTQGVGFPHYHVGQLDSFRWQRVAISWKEFMGSDEAPLGSGFSNLEVHKVVFTYSSGDLWLDDIRIQGATPSTFLR